MDVNESIISIPGIEQYKRDLASMYSESRKLNVLQEIGDLFYKAAHTRYDFIIFGPKDAFNKLFIYRGRELEESEANSVKMYSYPPEKYAICGRFNIEGKPVFYGSDSVNTAMLESRPKEGCIKYIGIWGVNAVKDVWTTSFVTENLPETNNWKVFADRFYGAVTDLSNRWPDKKEQILYGYDWINNLFQIEERPYPLTSWMGNDILYSRNITLNIEGKINKGAVDMAVYPSFVTKKHSSNIAISREFADAYMKLLRVYKVYVHDVKDDECFYHILQVGDVTGDEVKFRDPTPNEDKNGIVKPERQVNGTFYLRK